MENIEPANLQSLESGAWPPVGAAPSRRRTNRLSGTRFAAEIENAADAGVQEFIVGVHAHVSGVQEFTGGKQAPDAGKQEVGARLQDFAGGKQAHDAGKEEIAAR